MYGSSLVRPDILISFSSTYLEQTTDVHDVINMVILAWTRLTDSDPRLKWQLKWTADERNRLERVVTNSKIVDSLPTSLGYE